MQALEWDTAAFHDDFLSVEVTPTQQSPLRYRSLDLLSSHSVASPTAPASPRLVAASAPPPPQLPTTSTTTTTTASDDEQQLVKRKGSDGRPLNVLYAEDNAVNRKIIAAIVQKLDGPVQLEMVENGEEAYRAYCHKSYDLVLMDCMMPVMDGYEAARLIRNEEASRGLKAVPIIAVTASVQPDQIEKCLQSGMNEVLAKPFRREDFNRVIWKHVSMSSA